MKTTNSTDPWQLPDNFSRRSVSIGTAATLYDVSRDTVSRMIAAGELRAKKVRNTWHIAITELDRAFGVGDN